MHWRHFRAFSCNSGIFFTPQGKRGKAAAEEVNQMIIDLQLVDKTNSQSQKLSGGMKRKLR